MAGIIESVGQPAPQDDAPEQIDNPTLMRAKQEVEAKLPPEVLQTYQGIEEGAIQILTNPKIIDRVMAAISKGDPVEVISEGVANVIATVYNGATANMDDQQKQQFTSQFIAAVGPAALAVAAHVIDMAEKGIDLKVTPDILGEVTQAAGEKIFDKFGISGDMVQQAVNEGQKRGQ